MNGSDPAVSPAPAGRLICQRIDGIGGRLLTLLWTLRLARKVDAGVLLFWPKFELFYDHATGPGELFDLYRLASPPMRDRLQIVDGDCRRFLRFHEVNLEWRKAHDPSAYVVPSDADPLHEKLPVIVGNWEGPLIAPGETRQEALAEMPSVFAELPIRRDLLGHIERVEKVHKLYRMVAVHIRRGEIVRNLRQAVAGFRLNEPDGHDLLDDRIGTFARRCMSLDNFAEALRRFVEEGRTLVVFSDEPGVHDALALALGTPNVIPAASLVTGRFTPMQQAFVEACLMSRCRCIVGARSAYSTLANVIGANSRVLLETHSRTAEDCTNFALESVADELAAHPERAQVEQRIHEEIIRLRG